VHAQESRRIPVDYDDPALQAFMRAKPRSAKPLTGITPRDIPILDLVRPPFAGTTRALRKSSPSCRQTPITDEDPGWYAIRHDCGDLVITITGEQRVQARSAAAPPAALAKPMVIQPASGDARVEGGFVAEITLYRYPNIPYAITVECTKATLALCTSEAELQALVQNIDLVAVPQKK
jgi:hypothetical protein